MVIEVSHVEEELPVHGEEPRAGNGDGPETEEKVADLAARSRIQRDSLGLLQDLRCLVGLRSKGEEGRVKKNYCAVELLC